MILLYLYQIIFISLYHIIISYQIIFRSLYHIKLYSYHHIISNYIHIKIKSALLDSGNNIHKYYK